MTVVQLSVHHCQFTFSKKYIWAATCDFQQCGILTSVHSDEPVQPPFTLKTPNHVQSVA